MFIGIDDHIGQVLRIPAFEEEDHIVVKIPPYGAGGRSNAGDSHVGVFHQLDRQHHFGGLVVAHGNDSDIGPGDTCANFVDGHAAVAELNHIFQAQFLAQLDEAFAFFTIADDTEFDGGNASAAQCERFERDIQAEAVDQRPVIGQHERGIGCLALDG